MVLLVGCLGAMLLAATFLVGLGAGFGLGRISAREPRAPNASASIAPVLYECAQEPDGDGAKGLYPEFELFWEAMDLLYGEYFGNLPRSEDAAYESIRGVISLLDDPNTSLLTPEEADYYRSNVDGEFEGIGARVGWNEEADTLVITEPFENQPAWQAGLRRGDLILAVDGESIVGMGLAAAVEQIRGPEGSTVVLTVQSPGETTTSEVEIVRDRLDIPTISSATLGDASDVAYVRLNMFNGNAGQLIRESVRDAMRRNPRAMILDLRGNSGGLLREAVKVTNVFLEDEVVLFERFNDGEMETYRTEGRAVSEKVPLVVLVNEGSASASEIVAGALQDHGRATLIGTKTYGKGSVQLPHTLSDNGILRVTVARWLTPNERSIDGVGLQPDIVVPSDEGGYSDVEDPQLAAALQYIQEQYTTDSLDNP
jgi:carboxyl-terminal processing protease